APDRRALPRRQQRGLARRHLRGGRPAEHAGVARQSDFSGGARLVAQVLRIPGRQWPHAGAKLRRTGRPVLTRTSHSEDAWRTTLWAGGGAFGVAVTPASTAPAASCPAKA